MQCDADSVGAPGAAADAEMIMLGADVMKAAGLKTGSYMMRVNNRKLLDGILEASGVPNTEEGAVQRLKVLRAIDKLDRLGEDGVAALLGEGREDESGDYTQGAKLGAAGIKAVLGFTTASASDRGDTLTTLTNLVGASSAGQAGVDELKMIDTILNACDYGPDKVVFDTSIVRGLGYYTGPVFEAELLAEIKDRKGRPVRIGSIGGGGRYDDLVSRFRGQAVPATGFSFGVSRFANALARLNPDGQTDHAPVIICAFDRELMGEYFKMAAELHATGVRAEVFVGAGNVAKQLKYADRRNAKLAVLMGSDEMARGEVTIKDLVLGAEMAKAISDNKEWRENKDMQRTCSRDQLVATIKDMNT